MTSTVRRALPAAAAAQLAVVLAACGTGTGAPAAAPPTPRGAAAEACAALDGALPGNVDGLPRDAEGAPRYTAAWGDPAISLRCGVDRPEILTPGSEVYRPTADAVEVDGVSWLLEDTGAGYRFTTTRRTVHLEVTVPDAYAPEVNALVDLAPAVDAHLPLAPLWAGSRETAGAGGTGGP